ncbi:hypothetical protein PFICI_05892 [Pestalotiopsis fici W106-1]|uniref:DUF1740-domain-containing protein n=1 Tax=Pestalotiopsis fici (strain W106-1 / CGMCC3.15140) TaxID=1229662 RepID=W3XFM6_PESFW|nr:uncharacterized protein PFICI_05892 [Pestalotiopsis fici W106-1]ETS84016.1 hypothetical protein PFICI_05892 [Pestalotiopsis fici W106-1]
MPSQGPSSVPKFGSFKRKLERAPSPEQKQSHRKIQQTEDTSAQSYQRRSRNRQNNASSREAFQSSTPESPEDNNISGSRSDISHRPAPSSRGAKDELFAIDKRGDPLIRRYGCNDRYAIPSYRRFGRGRLLGSDAFFRTEPHGNREVFLLRSYREGGSELSRDRMSVLTKSARGTGDLVRVRQDKSASFNGTEDFLPLVPIKKQKRGRSGSDISLAEDQQPSYRSIHGMSKKHQDSESDETYDSDSSANYDLSECLDPIKKKGVQLTARIKDDPSDVSSWIELVEHQDVLRDLHSSNDRNPTQAEIKSYADIKLSMLEKAMRHCQSSDRVTELRLRIMLEGEKIWDNKTASQRWQELMTTHGNDFQVWTAFMAFQQSNLPEFSYQSIKQSYVQRLSWIKSELARENLDPGRQVLYSQLVIVFSRALQFIADSGYAELATAVWQAMLELHFQRPLNLVDGPPDAALSSFRNFWESEVPRIGEQDAQGWASYESNQESQEPPEPRLYDNFTPPHTRDPYKAWAAVEKQKAEGAKAPARTLDDGIDDDPYRVVMFSDFEDLLFISPRASQPLIQQQILDAFLVFCQMPPVFGSSSAIRSILVDQFMNGGQKAYITDQKPTRQQESVSSDMKRPDFASQMQSHVKTVEVAFPLSDWFRLMQPAEEVLLPEQYSLVSNVLKQLVVSFKNAGLATYYLAFDHINNPGSRKKTAKSLLKDHSSHVDLYLGFARSEYSKSNKDAARSILSAALGLAGLTMKDRVRLCVSQTWMELENGQLTKALAQLCLAAGGQAPEDPVSPARVLQTREFLTRNRDQMLSSRAVDDAEAYTEALSLLEYVTGMSGKESQSGVQGDVWLAVANINTFSAQLTSRGLAGSQTQETLFQFAAQLLYYHASHGPYRPGFFRECVEGYTLAFPRNTIFLSLYAWREDRLGIEDRVRSILDETVLSKANDCASSRAFAIRYEIATGNAHSACAAFERAVESNTCKNNTGIWISYIRYCHGKRELRLKAKSVFYRAIQRCPWSKDVFMEAFVTLARDMDTSELKSVYSTLCDKGLRVHVELDVFVENWKSTLKQEERQR